MSHRPNSLVLKHPGRRWARPDSAELIGPPASGLTARYPTAGTPRLVLTRSHHQPAKRIKIQFGDSAPTARPQKTGISTRSGEPSSIRMDSAWVYCHEFLDRDTALDRVPGK
jgi:hypothetical protein